MTAPAVETAGLYAASARRVLRERGLRDLGERLRRGEDRLVFVVGSPRSGTTFLAGTLGAMPGFVDLSEVNPHKAAIPRSPASRRCRPPTGSGSCSSACAGSRS